MSDDPDRCRLFYANVFDWEFDDSSMPGYTLIETGNDPGGGMMKRHDQAPGPGLNIYFLVDDIPAALEKIQANGGTVHCPETEIPNVGWWAYAADPEGIPFGIFKARQT
jgi:predicted enzyme related to lactoylglutathione lyase